VLRVKLRALLGLRRREGRRLSEVGSSVA
jgi:hypothetical protein